jgi:hypothetical protein
LHVGGAEDDMAKHGRAASKSVESAVRQKRKGTPGSNSGHQVTKDRPASAIGPGKPRARFVSEQDDYARLANDTVEVLLATKFGPRIVRYGFLGGENVLGEVPDLVTQTTLGPWRPRAGHRLWTSPEQMPRSYAPDNEPVDVQVSGTTVTLTQPIETATGVQKVMTVTLAAAGTEVIVQHRLVNHNIWSIEVAPWALTIMRPGGTVIVPQEPFISHAEQLLPVRAMALWGFTDLTDPRWHIGSRFIRLRTDSALAAPQKVGVANRQGWAAYLCEGELFVKRYAWDELARYPDFGVNTETFTAGNLIELETLGGLVSLAPGASTSHDERWFLFRGVKLPVGDDELARVLDKHVQATHTG